MIGSHQSYPESVASGVILLHPRTGKCRQGVCHAEGVLFLEIRKSFREQEGLPLSVLPCLVLFCGAYHRDWMGTEVLFTGIAHFECVDGRIECTHLRACPLGPTEELILLQDWDGSWFFRALMSKRSSLLSRGPWIGGGERSQSASPSPAHHVCA